ncbi:uncharacterized protein STEHIDRAFT_173036 [Stereum hirsutum FP-91666 SS1]|uniref:Uncharacterized protein n=1 Tax=Stereum hirsutum (strain FP-91666) TaxID=721885 RepID=R7RXT5_STEHR|nr:uncharacterized protein STEHIDRAFT_173036 [Stereum hirsutum FP-91666 SS1]EIM79705.1 hypothetical protein STEHIDRAFT_173036 [Stereum hirsutum FP-91666 SS1]
MTFAVLRVLQTIIGEAIDDIERVYSSAHTIAHVPSPFPAHPHSSPSPSCPPSLFSLSSGTYNDNGTDADADGDWELESAPTSPQSPAFPNSPIPPLLPGLQPSPSPDTGPRSERLHDSEQKHRLEPISTGNAPSTPTAMIGMGRVAVLEDRLRCEARAKKST